MKKLPNRLLTTTIIMAGMALPFTVNATNGILPLGNGMTAHGFGGAGIANAADAMSGVDNPANLTTTADQMSLGMSLFSPKRAADVGFGTGYVESDSNLFFIPQFAWTKTANQEMSWGILVNAMGGMNTDYPGKLFNESVKVGMDLQGIIVSPTIGYKQSSDTSFGASLLLGYESLETSGTGAPPTGAPVGTPPLPENEKDTATGYGVKIGVTTKAMADLVLGFTYQTSIKMGEMSKHCDFIFSSASDCSLDLPPMFGLGVNYALSADSKIVADVQRVNWASVAVFDELFGWENQTILKIGYEQRVNEGYAWRIGFNYGKSPIPDDAVANNVLAPAVSEKHLTFGFTKKIGSDELVGYYAYVPEEEQTQEGGGARIKMSQHALGVGYNWK